MVNSTWQDIRKDFLVLACFSLDRKHDVISQFAVPLFDKGCKYEDDERTVECVEAQVAPYSGDLRGVCGVCSNEKAWRRNWAIEKQKKKKKKVYVEKISIYRGLWYQNLKKEISECQ